MIFMKNYNPHDEEKDALALSFIPQAMDETILCNVAKAASSKEARKILEEEFGARGVTCNSGLYHRQISLQ